MAKKKVKAETVTSEDVKTPIEVVGKVEHAKESAPKKIGDVSSYSVKFTDGDFIQTELTLPEAKAKVKQLEDQDKILKGKNWVSGFYKIV